MRKSDTPSVYSQVAFDLASKIASGVWSENTRFSGRSLMSTQYGVSQETIRRALKLLSDQGIVGVQQNSGAVVFSKEKAAAYVAKFQSAQDLRALKNELRTLMAERSRLDARIEEIVTRITDLKDRFTSSDPLHNYEFEIAPGSRLVGKTVRQAKFWQNTEATIVAIISDGKINLSPGPDAVFQAGDTLVVAGTPDNANRVRHFIA